MCSLALSLAWVLSILIASQQYKYSYSHLSPVHITQSPQTEPVARTGVHIAVNNNSLAGAGDFEDLTNLLQELSVIKGWKQARPVLVSTWVSSSK